MYTHARQFPHFTGMSDVEIRTIARRAMANHPGLIRVMRFRNLGTMLAMIVATAVLTLWAALDMGIALMIVGGVATLLVLAWNVIWINTVMFRITREELERGQAESPRDE